MFLLHTFSLKELVLIAQHICFMSGLVNFSSRLHFEASAGKLVPGFKEILNQLFQGEAI